MYIAVRFMLFPLDCAICSFSSLKVSKLVRCSCSLPAFLCAARSALSARLCMLLAGFAKPIVSKDGALALAAVTPIVLGRSDCPSTGEEALPTILGFLVEEAATCCASGSLVVLDQVDLIVDIAGLAGSAWESCAKASSAAFCAAMAALCSRNSF